MRVELKCRDDAKIPVTPAKPPEQVRVHIRAGAHGTAINAGQLCRAQIINAQPALARQVAEPATERQARNARGRDKAARRRQTMRLRLPVEIADERTRFDTRSPSRRVNLNRVHPQKVQHQAAVARGVARNVVPASLDGDLQVVIAGEPYCARNIVRVPGLDDDCGAASCMRARWCPRACRSLLPR